MTAAIVVAPQMDDLATNATVEPDEGRIVRIVYHCPTGRCTIQLVSERDEPLGSALDVHVNITRLQLEKVCNALLKQSDNGDTLDDDAVPCQFFLDNERIDDDLKS